MGFGISYELIITVFIVLLGILFITLGYTHLVTPIVQTTFIIGLLLILVGWMNKDYDTLYTGIILFIIPLLLISAAPSLNVPKAAVESGLNYAIEPLVSFLSWLYFQHPLALALFIALVALALSKK